MNKKSKKKPGGSSIAVNRKAHHDYILHERMQAGLVLEGWEVKSLRQGRAQISESYVIINQGEVWLVGGHIPPLITASTHIKHDSGRTRKLLLNRREIGKLVGATQRKGFTIVPLKIYWSKKHAKLEIAVAEGKKTHDKRQSTKERDWNRQKQRVMKRGK